MRSGDESDTEPGRAQRPGLLSRPPAAFRALDTAGAALFIDPAAQITALAELMDKGLLSRDEFDRAKQRALRWSNDG
jgi:Short C-terminal domain